jgi:hypothetical protein
MIFFCNIGVIVKIMNDVIYALIPKKTGVYFIKLFCINLSTLLCKLDHCFSVDIIFLCCEKIQLFKKTVIFQQKFFMRSTQDEIGHPPY